MAPSNNEEAQTTSEPTKEHLEIRKLQLEIAEMQRWWRRPAYAQLLTAIVAASGTLILGYFNGWFDVQRGRLEIQRAQVQGELATLQAGRSDLGKQVKILAAERDRLLRTNTDIEQRLQALNSQAKQSAKGIAKLSGEKNACSAAVNDLVAKARANTEHAEKETKSNQKVFQTDLNNAEISPPPGGFNSTPFNSVPFNSTPETNKFRIIPSAKDSPK